MIAEISAAVAVLIFSILVFFIIRTLKKVDRLVSDLDSKLKLLDSPLKTLSNIGDVSKKESEEFRKAYLENEGNLIHKPRVATDLAEWLIVSIKLGEKLLKRR